MQQSSLLSLATKISGLVCPRCNGTAYHKFGIRLGIQRYCCKNCRRTFNETVNTPLHGIHNKQKMQEYLLTMNGKQSIRAASKKIGISVPTSFSWRHRILASLREQTPSAGSSTAGICEIKLPHSFKGKRNVPDTKMPETHSIFIADARGIPCIQLLLKPKKTYEAALLISNTLRPSSKFEIIKTNLLTRVSRKITTLQTKNKFESTYLAKQVVDAVAELSGWMARFKGVATKYLQQYWNWYRAALNAPDLSYFTTECFGKRQLPYFRQITAV